MVTRGSSLATTIFATLGCGLAAGCTTPGEPVERNPTMKMPPIDRRGEGASGWSGQPPYPGPCVKVGDRGNDGYAEWTLARKYNAAGDVVEEVYDHGADGSADTVYRYEYEQGRLVRRLKDAHADTTPDEITTYRYDEQGRRVKAAHDMNADGQADRVFAFSYDEQGRRSRKTLDYGGDGQVDAIWTFEYVEATERRAAEYWDQDADGGVDEVVKYAYDAKGRLVRETLDQGDDGTVEQTVEYRYADGQLASEARYRGQDLLRRKVTYSYDDAGRKKRVALDEDGDGTVEQATLYEWDEQGNMSVEKVDMRADGTYEQVITFDYGCWRS